MLGHCQTHRPVVQAAFVNRANTEPLVLAQCAGCTTQPYQLCDRAGLIVRFYSAQQGAVLAERIAKSRTKVVPLPARG